MSFLPSHYFLPPSSIPPLAQQYGTLPVFESIKEVEFQQLARFLENSVLDVDMESANERLRRGQNLVQTLQAIRGIIHNCLKLDHDPSSLQAAMAGVTLPITALLQETNEDMVREAVACLATLLHDGHPDVQRQFTSYFSRTTEEQFFVIIQTRMRAAMTHTRELRSLRRQVMEDLLHREKLQSTLSLTGLMSQSARDSVAEISSARPSKATSQDFDAGTLASVCWPEGRKEDASSRGTFILTFSLPSLSHIATAPADATRPVYAGGHS